MSLDRKDVQRIADLARIRMEPEQLDTMVGELNAILSWIEQLNEVDTDGIEPLTSVTGHALPLRPDTADLAVGPDTVLGNAPDRAADFYAVPKVVE